MKRLICLCLILALLLPLFGCETAEADGTVEFYYQRTTYVYGSEDGVIASEIREVSDRSNTLPYVLSLYLRGPLDTNLKAPFPTSTKMLGVTQDGSTLCVTLDSTFTELKNLELTLACACIAKTCFSLADVTQVQIRSVAPDSGDSVNMIISVDNLLMENNSGLPQQTITEESQ